jgi:putative restriction endonuclease
MEGVRVPLMGPQGIFKPKVLAAPLSITTSTDGPYDDSVGGDGLLRYRYRGTDPHHRDNEGLRDAMASGLPLVYFQGIVPGKYLATWPVFIVADDPANLVVTVDVEAAGQLGLLTPAEGRPSLVREDGAFLRSYAAVRAKVRLHQRSFRERVLEAYRRQCAFCSLRHEELLDAAHIIPDSDPLGEPVVSNGLALCALHHSAFDRQFIGLRPDYLIEVRRDILLEKDGPTLAHAIQGIHGQRILLPHAVEDRPDPAFLEQRYQEFRKAV